MSSSFTDLGRGLLVGAHHRTQVFRVELAGELRGTHQVTEQHRELPPFCVWRTAGHHRGMMGTSSDVCADPGPEPGTPAGGRRGVVRHLLPLLWGADPCWLGHIGETHAQSLPWRTRLCHGVVSMLHRQNIMAYAVAEAAHGASVPGAPVAWESTRVPHWHCETSSPRAAMGAP
jgi:hypothetical protein